MKNERIFLCPPHQSGHEAQAVLEALSSNWLAPAGAFLEEFESRLARLTGFRYAVALSSGTAAIHLGLKVLGVEPGSEVLASDVTFAGSVFPIVYEKAQPVFIDAQPESWNIDTNLVEDYFRLHARKVSALLPTHLYGMPADTTTLEKLSEQYGVPVLHDLAECLAGKVNGLLMGKCIRRGVLSFNGNKLITTSGGGAYLTHDAQEAESVLRLATQAKSGERGYTHRSIGYNYRMSNVLAALGMAQIKTLDERINRKRAIFHQYQEALSPVGLQFQIEEEGLLSDRWMTAACLSEKLSGSISVDQIINHLEKNNIESRPVWKPMHLQPVFAKATVLCGQVAERLYRKGVCLPSGCGLTTEQQDTIIRLIQTQIISLEKRS